MHQMQSGIFAVVTIGPYRLYVGEVHHLKTRWKVMLEHFETGNYPHAGLQAAWDQWGAHRRFNFYKAADLLPDRQLWRRSQLLKDLETADEPVTV